MCDVYIFVCNNDQCCSIRVPQRQTLSVMYSLVKGVFWITTMWYLVVCFHGLLEMNYYINNNCTSGTCYTYIIPDYGWLVQVVIVLLMSCCLYVKIRKLSQKKKKTPFEHTHKKHKEAKCIHIYIYIYLYKIAESERAPIKLVQVLNLQDTARKIMLYAAVCWFMQRSGFVTIANLEKGHGTNIVGVFIPIGWYNVKWSDAIDTTKNSNLVAAGTILGSISAFVGWASLACFLYLLHVVVKFKSGKLRRTLFLVLCSFMSLLWIFGGGLFYYRFYMYWENGGKSAVPPPDTGIPGSATGTPLNTFWYGAEREIQLFELLFSMIVGLFEKK
ncbi:hypothetical protein RFI_07176 [Reticulomyxa filosa]|uniref:Uncharacterized protein n=1 Tax=Reticulomyxa filosa TaxID=46433 RepID=X6NVP0_RETFI|nr:hypothetical protein RFI_07176 [Reticulomyxa filosa]|eukprot:ETO29948.1 hypothetical protein RFI_07176 [Reticulomyxa filosa]